MAVVLQLRLSNRRSVMENAGKAKNLAEIGAGEEEMLSRRDFLDTLGKWSKIVIGAAIFGGALFGADREANAGWANRGGGWINRGGGGGGWINRGGGAGWANRGGSWVNRY